MRTGLGIINVSKSQFPGNFLTQMTRIYNSQASSTRFVIMTKTIRAFRVIRVERMNAACKIHER